MTIKAPDTAKALRVALASKGMKRKDLATRVGVTANHMSRLTNGAVAVQGDLLTKISSAFGMKVSEFLAMGEE